MLIFVVSAIYPSKYKKSGEFIRTQCEALAKKGNTVVVLDSSTISIRNWKKTQFNYTNFHEGSLHVYRKLTKGVLSNVFPLREIRIYNKNVDFLYHEATKKYGKPDIFYVHFSFPSGVWARKKARIEKIPFYILEHHSLFLKKCVNPIIVFYLKRCVIDSNGFACVSDHLASSIEKKCNIKKETIPVLPNMISSVFKFSPKNGHDDYFRFVSVGNLIKSKGMAELIDSFYEAFNNNASYYLEIIGDGPERNNLLCKIANLGLSNSIKLVGTKTPYEVFETISRSDCFVLLSKYETFGIAYREALIVGRPIICLDNDGIKIGWNDKYGIMVHSVSDVPKAMQSIVSSYSSYNQQMISQEISEKYSEDKVMDSISNILEKCVKGENKK